MSRAYILITGRSSMAMLSQEGSTPAVDDCWKLSVEGDRFGGVMRLDLTELDCLHAG